MPGNLLLYLFKQQHSYCSSFTVNVILPFGYHWNFDDTQSRVLGIYKVRDKNERRKAFDERCEMLEADLILNSP